VFTFHQRIGLTPTLLREVSVHQVGVLQAAVEALDAPRDLVEIIVRQPDRRAGFLAVRSSRAAELCEGLRARGVTADSRGTTLRLGPAPYLTDDQLRDAVSRLGDAIAGR
jgi:kynureninase